MAARPELVIFDMDGVLFRLSKRQRLANLARLTGLPPGQVHAAIWGSGFDGACDRGEYDAAACHREACTRLGVPLSVEDWIGARVAAMRPKATVWRLVARVRRRAQVATLTNNNQLLKRELPRHFPQLREHFGDHFLTSSDFRRAKPDPALFRAVTAHLGVPPSAAVFVDDWAEFVAGAREAGLRAHHFTSARGLAGFLRECGLV